MIKRSTVQLLRFHFSFFLLPVYLFALSQLPHVSWTAAIIAGIVLHLFIYPASNGYNSYMDRDTTPIGGLLHPLQPTRQLFWTTVIMDIAGVALSLYINFYFALGILFYIIASRAYSNRTIRLKRYPVTGFLTVFVCQGALIFFIVYNYCGEDSTSGVLLLPALISSFLIGALYPLTQVYQHEADKADGVTTISYILGKRGSFVFSGILFLAAAVSFFIYFSSKGERNNFLLFLLYTLPVVSFFGYWMLKVWKDESNANFKNSLRMNVIATLCITSYFLTLILRNH
ncbi:MAG TPA: UbiA family prenyltransferase [Chitinophagaceae bacterium]|jgi:1,4-dihydroxy-2-naphthoate octaprenyltransferase|nr:UbiA family prenyltransferase [Chitinophagaceae bacterium]